MIFETCPSKMIIHVHSLKTVLLIRIDLPLKFCVFAFGLCDLQVASNYEDNLDIIMRGSQEIKSPGKMNLWYS